MAATSGPMPIPAKAPRSSSHWAPRRADLTLSRPPSVQSSSGRPLAAAQGVSMKLHRLLAVAWLVLATGCAHAMGSIADVSIVDRATRQPISAHWHEGRAYVVGRPGAEYEIVLCNRTGEDVLAVVSVDGVNVVSGETAGVQQAGYVLGPWQAGTLRGWRKSLEETASFYFTSLGDSYAGRTQRP